MLKGMRFAQALIGVAVVGWIVGLLVKPQADVREVVPSWNAEDVVEQTVTTRSSRSVEERAFRLSTADEVFKPSVLRVDGEDNLFVLDFGDHRIKKYGPRGELLKMFGEGTGIKPGQFANPTDFALTADGDVWVADPVNERLTVFSEQGELEELVELETTPIRLALKSDGGFYVMSAEAGELFEEYDAERRLVRRFGRLLETESQSTIALDGWIAVTADDELVFAPTWLGVFAVYADGKQTVLAETFDAAPLPTVIDEGDGWQSINPRSWAVNRSLSVENSSIQLFTVQGRGPAQQAILDVFDTGGAYQESLLLPTPGSVAVATARSVFTVHDGVVERWRRPGVQVASR